ncbi:N-6 DNA methylase [Anaerococcus marasmi]|uniref:N-6 DNA methylase n=1 Tax=Anaerococcus marasmi TaxID=2057797 RepID=UPI001319DE6D|nr:N-6 DNA methylase [Anaerococcus marasmi]
MSEFNKKINEKFWKFIESNRSYLDRYIRENLYFVIACSYFDDDIIKKYEKVRENESINLIFSKIREDHSSFIDELRSEFSKEELEILLTNNKLNHYLDPRYNLSIGENILNILISLLDVKDNDIILNPFSSDGEIISSILKQDKDVIIEGMEIDSYKRNIAIIKNSILSDKFQLMPFNPENSNIVNKNTNKLIAFPPAGNRWMHKNIVDKSKDVKTYLEENSINRFGDLVYIIKNLQELEKLERAIYIYPTGRLFNHIEKDILQFLVNNGLIEGIVQLPEGIIEGTGISFSILIISQDNEYISFVDARNEYKKERFKKTLTDINVTKILEEYKNPNQIAKQISLKDIITNDYVLLPSRLIVPADQKLSEYYLLKDISNMQRGIGSIKKSDLEKRMTSKKTKIKYMQATDFSDTIDYTDLKTLDEIKENETRYLAKDRDIVISKVQNFKSMIFEDTKDYKIIISGNLYKIEIKADSDVNPYYVQAYLATDHAKEQISRLVSGTSTLIIPITTLGELKIPKLDKDAEENIANNYKAILRRMRIVKEQIKKLEEDKNVIFDGVI